MIQQSLKPALGVLIAAAVWFTGWFYFFTVIIP